MPAKTEEVPTSSQADSITINVEDQAKQARFWLENTTEGKAFLAGFKPPEIFMLGETLPGNPMEPDKKPVTRVHHALGYYLTEREAEKGLKNRPLVVVKVMKAD